MEEGVGVRLRWVVGGGLPGGNEGKGEGGGEAGCWGGDRQRNRKVNAHVSVKLPFSKLPSSLCPKRVLSSLVCTNPWLE